MALPEAPLGFLKNLPVAWDSTLLLQGTPGKECIIARRSGSDWYIGGINGTDEPKDWEIDISRLNKQEYTTYIIFDGKNNKDFKSIKRTLPEGKKLAVKVLPYGGFLAKLVNPN